jgi:hypothetical protein
VAAAACGLAAGRYVLPPPPGSAHPAARSATQKAATGPVTTADLLDPAAFGSVGITAPIHARDRFGDGAYANSACTGEKTLTQTLGGPGAHFRGLMTGSHADPGDPTMALHRADQVAREVAAEALTPALAQNFTERLLLEEVPCQDEPPGHWVYGRTTTLGLGPGLGASWMGTYQGALNTSGRAPEGKEPCGGIAVLRSGNHYGVLEVDACLGTAAMSSIVRAALSRL